MLTREARLVEADVDEYLTERCRQCGDTVVVREDEPRFDGPFICDDCIRRTVNRAASATPWAQRVLLKRGA